jgi:hypothetical protein
MVLVEHLRYYEEVLTIPGLLQDPVLTFGFQDIATGVTLDGKQYENFGQFVCARGMTALSLDLFDPRSELRYDMNYPVPEAEIERFGTLIDIGSLEHVFDTKQCLANCLGMIRTGGYYLLHTAVNGYYGHGIHVFAPEALIACLELNGFEIGYIRFSGMDGTPLESPRDGTDALVWIVAKKVRQVNPFACPQQRGWADLYEDTRRVRDHVARFSAKRMEVDVLEKTPGPVLDPCTPAVHKPSGRV